MVDFVLAIVKDTPYNPFIKGEGLEHMTTEVPPGNPGAHSADGPTLGPIKADIILSFAGYPVFVVLSMIVTVACSILAPRIGDGEARWLGISVLSATVGIFSLLAVCWDWYLKRHYGGKRGIKEARRLARRRAISYLRSRWHGFDAGL